MNARRQGASWGERPPAGSIWGERPVSTGLACVQPRMPAIDRRSPPDVLRGRVFDPGFPPRTGVRPRMPTEDGRSTPDARRAPCCCGGPHAGPGPPRGVSPGRLALPLRPRSHVIGGCRSPVSGRRGGGQVSVITPLQVEARSAGADPERPPGMGLLWWPARRAEPSPRCLPRSAGTTASTHESRHRRLPVSGLRSPRRVSGLRYRVSVITPLQVQAWSPGADSERPPRRAAVVARTQGRALPEAPPQVGWHYRFYPRVTSSAVAGCRLAIAAKGLRCWEGSHVEVRAFPELRHLSACLSRATTPECALFPSYGT